jgi:hypothetical protein
MRAMDPSDPQAPAKPPPPPPAADLPDRPQIPTTPAEVAGLDLPALLRPPPSTWPRRRIAALVLALVAAAGAVGAAVWLYGARWKAPHETAELDDAIYLAPIKTEREATGEETAPFSGFALSIDTVPPGAVISVAGEVRGEAPLLANVTACRGTEKLEIRAVKKGFRPARRLIACRADTLVKLTLRLEP